MKDKRPARTKTPPVSVAVTQEQREQFEDEAQRRGLGVSSTIRSLAVERIRELREQRQLERARRWQTERMRALADRIEKGEVGEASWAEIDAIFEQAAARDRRSSRASA